MVSVSSGKNAIVNCVEVHGRKVNLENQNSVVIETPRLVLREVREGDEENIALHANNILVSQYMELLPFPYSLKDARWWINHNKEKKAKGGEISEYNFGIILRPGDEVIGVIGVNKINHAQESCGMGYWLGEEYWRRGIMQEAASAALDFAFNNLNLRRINISAAVENVASNALIRKLGFVHEGIRRQYMISKANGKVHDIHVYGLLRDEWKRVKSKQ